jgi:transcriptional regulator with XRE-family HTH domain
MATPIRDRWDVLRVQLRDARNAAGLLQEEVARGMTDVPAQGEERRSWLSRLENGRAVPSAETVIGWARAVGLEIAAVPPAHAALLDLKPSEITDIIRAAHAVSTGRQLDLIVALRVRAAMVKLSMRRAA